ncbi:MAG TPA: asparagine synthase (glutamine-hydrolyzing) [Pyrinomonadaceae bacterium]|nr:asparagine synthase (glutamine-hydrolyzing) [Pyrinomonadaceae bacterium]
MCGIAGFVSRDEHADARAARATLERMCGIIEHRGPDEEGFLVEGPAAMGMRRLSIIDLAGGHQPLSGCDPAVSVVFNGEIYNFRELQPLLEARGHRFRTHSDTEAIVHAYEEFGPACVEHLRGMFAFAIWDSRKRELFVARDRAGEKPLYYTTTPEGTFVFGSELKCLLEHTEVRRETDAEALDAYLTFGYVPDPLTIFRDVHKLPPGHTLTLEAGRVMLRQYWDFTYEPVEDARPVEDYLEELRAMLDESVRMRLVSDVPLGAFLSGGVDSSTVVGLMARATDRPVKTFSIGFSEDSYDELRFARVAAREFATEHHEFVVTPEICSVVDELVWHFDEPFADSSAIPTYVVSKLAREHVKVVLSGDGGDELFAGYTRYVTDKRRSGFERLPRAVRKNLMQPVGRALPHGAWGRNFIHNVAFDALDRYVEDISVFTRLDKSSLYSDAFRSQLSVYRDAAPARFRSTAARARSGEALDSLLYLDSKTYLPGDILTKVDRMSMAVSLEARVPLLDHKLIEFVTRIPAAHKLKGLETKHVFKRAVRGLVPDAILDRPKQGFGVPIERWINERLRERVRGTLTESRTRQRGLFEQSHVALLLDEHERGRRDHSHRLWSLFMLELWQRTFADGSPSRPRARESSLAPAVV